MKKPIAKKRSLKPPAFAYVSVCCNVVAEKPACTSYGSVTTRIPGGLNTVTVARGKESETQGLGSWRCTGCRKPCTVSRSKFVPENNKLTQTV